MDISQIISGLNQNAGAVQAISAALLVFITGYYAYQTRKTVKLMSEAKIEISYQNVWVHNMPQYDPTKSYFNITVRNKSRNSVRIEKAAIKPIGSGWLLLGDSFIPTRNRVLTPENPTTEFLIEASEIDLGDSQYISIYDGFGNEHRKYLHKFPMLWLAWQKIKKRKKS